MCGIAGIVHKGPGLPDRATIERMTRAVAHRGPDGEGFASFENVALGHRRLAIVDLTDSGAQPMHSADGRYAIVHNGEVYNHLELRAELSRLGHAFRGTSDTEVILAAFAQWGEACLHRFNGMWAFAVLDRLARRLFLARDRFGVKPLHYVDTGSAFAFGSEIKQLLPLLDSRAADEEALLDFLAFGLQDHLPERTSFAAVRRLPAGCTLTVRLDAPEAVVRRWYALPAAPPEAEREAEREPSEAAERIVALLEDAVSLRLRADVPVGTCLSGGLDSSSIAALAAPRYASAAGRRFVGITASSEQDDNDETPFARAVAEHVGLDLRLVRPCYDDFAATVDAIHASQDEPVGGPSLTMQWHVMRAARQAGLPVLLDGQGGDETLLGYERYFGNAFWDAWRGGRLRRALALLRRARTVNDRMGAASTLRYLLGTRFASLRALGHRRDAGALRRAPPLASALRDLCASAHDPAAVQRIEIERTNLPALLRYEDRNSMAHSIETRLPFLDYRFVEAAIALPAALKLRDGWTKWPLRAGIGGRLPESVRWRRLKLGFEAPERTWLGRHRAEIASAIRESARLRDALGPRPSADALQGIGDRMAWRLYSVARWEAATGAT
jgi:asparagine synthase (glutamine-hydrolysing)